MRWSTATVEPLEPRVLLAAAGWQSLVRISPEYGGGQATASSDPVVTVSPVTHTPMAVFQTRWNPADANDTVVNFARAVRRPDGSLDWSDTQRNPAEVAPRGAKHVSASVAVGAYNGLETIHVTYWDHLASEQFMYVRSLDGGRTWTTPFALSTSGKVAGKVGLAADVVGNVYAVWSDWGGNANANGLDICFRQYSSATNAWTNARKIESDPSTKSQFPQVIRSPGGRLDVAWADRVVVPRKVSYTISTDNGGTFAPPQTVFTAADDKDIQGATLAVAADGTPYVAAVLPPSFGNTGTTYTWFSYQDRSAPGQPWSAARRVWGSHPSANPFFTADRGGRVYLSWLRYPNTENGPRDMVVKWRDGAAAHEWSDPPEQMATTTGTWKGYSGGNVAVDTRETVPTQAYVVTDDTPDGRHQIYATYRDVGPTSVAARRVYYNNSAFDGNSPAVDARDDVAVATDKQALLPGQRATFANYTSYSRGINGLTIDFAGMPTGPLTKDDFVFKVGNDDTPGDWAAAPAPSAVVLRALPTGANTARVAITWPDGAVRKTWLQVTVKANQNTGLAAPDVFYFGNAVGESGNSASDAMVTFADEAGARMNSRTMLNPAPVDFPWDYDRNRKADPRDQIIARNNKTTAATALRLITPPAAPPAAPAAPAQGGGGGRGAMPVLRPVDLFPGANALRRARDVGPGEEE